jgi:hypothetical protein
MARKKKTEFTDEYFINLIMPFDEKDDEIYQKWAIWCANSDKYVIDAKDNYFYTRNKETEPDKKRIGLFDLDQEFSTIDRHKKDK